MDRRFALVQLLYELLDTILVVVPFGFYLSGALVEPSMFRTARIAELRAAFDAMIKDAGFQEAAAKRKLVIAPTPGPEVQAIVQKVVSYAPAVIERARTVSGVKD